MVHGEEGALGQYRRRLIVHSSWFIVKKTKSLGHWSLGHQGGTLLVASCWLPVIEAKVERFIAHDS